MKTRFLTAARKELTEAIAHYNEQHEGLGFRFSDEGQINLKKNPGISGRQSATFDDYPPSSG